MISNLFPVWPLTIDPLAMVALALLAATVVGELFFRLLGLPRLTGYTLVGLICGPSLLGWIGERELASMRLLIDLVLALLLFEIGVRVNLRWFRHNPLVLATCFLESLLAFAAVFSVILYLGYSLEIALVVATVSMATSPAAVMALTGQLKARGQVTDRLLVITAFNVAFAILIARVVMGYIHRSYGNDWLIAIFHPVYQLLGSLAVAYLLAKGFYLLRRYFDPAREQSSLMLFGLLMLTLALLQALKLPALLAPLLAGVVVKQTDPRPHVWPLHFGSVGGAMVILLFVMIGSSLNWKLFWLGGAAAFVLILVRCGGKLLGVVLLGGASGLSIRQSLSLGACLVPMSGVAFTLTDDIGQLFPAMNAELKTIVMSMIFVLELLGPIILQRSLIWIGEAQTGEKNGT